MKVEEDFNIRPKILIICLRVCSGINKAFTMSCELRKELPMEIYLLINLVFPKREAYLRIKVDSPTCHSLSFIPFL